MNTYRSRTIISALSRALALTLAGAASCTDASQSATPQASIEGAAAPRDEASAVALRLEQAERKLDTGRDLKDVKAALAAVLEGPDATPEQRDKARLAMSRALEAEGDREGATAAVEALLADHADSRPFPLLEATERRLRKLLTGSDVDSADTLSDEPQQTSPFARALAAYYPVPAEGKQAVTIDAYVFGGSVARSEKLGTFGVAAAIRALRREACPLCDPHLSINASFYRTGKWVSIPKARAHLASSLSVFYFDLEGMRIPSRYDAELPMPSAEIVARLEKGEGVVAVKERKGAPPSVLIAAPRAAQHGIVEGALAAMKSIPTAPVSVALPQQLLPEEVQAVVREGGFAAFRACYEALLTRSPAAAGTVPLKFVIHPDGTVSGAHVDAAATLRDPTMEQCMTAAMSALTFPAYTGKDTTVTYPVAFAPGE